MIIRRFAEALRRQDWATVTVELTVVVVGVIVGLQVNNWNHGRQEQALEQEYLLRLLDDLQADVATFESLENTFQTKARMIRLIRDTHAREIVKPSSSTLVQDLEFTTWKALPWTRSATFDELSGSGRLVLLHDRALRGALSDYYAAYRKLSEILAVSDGNYRRLFFGAFPGEVFSDILLIGEVEDTAELIKALAKLKAMPGFEEAANQEIAYAAGMIFYLRRFRGEAKVLISLIRDS